MTIRDQVWWVWDGRLAGFPEPDVDPRRYSGAPRGAAHYLDDVKVLSELGVRSLISAIDRPRHERAFTAAGFAYLRLPVPGGLVPSRDQVDSLLRFVQSAPCPMGIHCRGGMGRTGTLIALVLMSWGLSSTAAIQTVRLVNPAAIETREQEEFLGCWSGSLA